MTSLTPYKQPMFSSSQYEYVTADGNAQLKKAIERARIEENVRVRPTLEERRAMMESALDFVRQRGRIVYGGYAIHMLVSQASGGSDGIYDFSTEAPDIEFYSSDAVIDARDMCDAFHVQGHRYVRAAEALHSETFKVSVDLVQLCDITYVPKNIARIIPYVLIDGVRYAHPHFMLVDSLRILTDPINSYWRLEKAFPRMYKLQRYYPFERPEMHEWNLSTAAPHAESAVNAVIASAVKFLESSEQPTAAVLIGYGALQRFAEQHGGRPPAPLGIPFLEVILTDYKDTMPRLFEHLRTTFGEQVRYEEFHRFFDYCGHRGHIYIGDHLAVRAFHHNNRCTPVVVQPRQVEVERPQLPTGTLSVVALYLLISKLICRAMVPPNRVGQSICDSLIFELFRMRDSFLEQRQQDIMGAHPFVEFSSNCVGHTVSLQRARKEEIEFRRSRAHRFGMIFFTYEPSSGQQQQQRQQQQKKTPEYVYMNSSGNVIRGAQDRLFDPPAEALKTVAPPRASEPRSNARKSQGGDQDDQGGDKDERGGDRRGDGSGKKDRKDRKRNNKGRRGGPKSAQRSPPQKE